MQREAFGFPRRRWPIFPACVVFLLPSVFFVILPTTALAILLPRAGPGFRVDLLPGYNGSMIRLGPRDIPTPRTNAAVSRAALVAHAPRSR